MILPLIEYGNCFLLGCTMAEKTKIQRAQNKGLKIAFNRNRCYSTKQLHKDAKIAPWEVRARIAANRLMFKYKHITSNLDQGRTGTRLQSGPVFKIERPKSKSYINSIAYIFRSRWNELPPSFGNIEDQQHFNLVVKRFHVTHYFEST